MNWAPDDDAQEMLAYFKKLVALRRDYADLIAGGTIAFNVLPIGVVEVSRTGAGKVLKGLFNTTGAPAELATRGQLLLSQGMQGHQLAPDGFAITIE